MKQKYFWLKLAGTAVLLHVILILLSILEVAFYSYLINPGQDKSIYDAHAVISGPWISSIFGSLLMFFFVKRYMKGFTSLQLTYAIALPVIYLIIDIILIFAAGYEFHDYLFQFVSTAIPKFFAALLSWFLYRVR